MVHVYHGSTKHGTSPEAPERLVAFHRLDPTNAPRPFKKYRGLETTPLPRTLVESNRPATEVLSGRRGERRDVDANLLATLLFLGAGVTRTAGGRFFRAAMSAGNLHPVEVYVVAGPGTDGIPEGVHHFGPLSFDLTRLRSNDLRARLGVDGEVGLVLTGIVWRTAWKYGERGWRHLYWDAGTMLANLLAACDAHGVPARVLTGFDDAGVSRAVGIDGVDEMPLAVVSLGEGGGRVPGASSLEALGPDVAPIAPRPIRLPLVAEAQGSGALEQDDVDAWRRRGLGVGEPAPEDVEPPGEERADPVEAVILRRGSTRVMLRAQLTETALAWPMRASTRGASIDAAPGRTLLTHYLGAHAVAGLAPGSYRWSPTGLALIEEIDEIRARTATLCLDQPLGGDSVYTVFHCADLEAVLESLGPRGYRVAQLESGIVSGRLALCAFALELGATGLTFFDDEVSRFFRTTAQPMLVTAVGVPDGPPAPSGRPGEPAVLRGFDGVIRRMTARFRR